MKTQFFIFFACVMFVESNNVQKILHNGNSQLTARMFSEIVKSNEGKSVVLSAFSLITPLSQLADASEGETRDELLNAIGFTEDTAANAVFGLIDGNFDSIQGIELKKASKLYIPVDYQVHDAFATVSIDVYHSEIANVDFSDNKKAAKEINTWVQTNHRIKDLVDPNLIKPYTRGVLVNALYFKGSWKYPLMDYATRDENFYVNKQITLQIPTMYNTEEYKYKESEILNSKILELPYVGDQSSFVIILPNDKEGIGQLIEKLKDPNILDKEWSDMLNVEVQVSILKFKIETKTDLKEVLTKINVTKIFDENANLTKLLKTDESLYVSDAVQKAFIEINEKGAEAAAANAFFIAGEIALIDSPNFDFIADHPFAFFLKIRDEIFFNGVFYGS